MKEGRQKLLQIRRRISLLHTASRKELKVVVNRLIVGLGVFTVGFSLCKFVADSVRDGLKPV